MSLNCGYIPKDDPSYNFIRAERFVDNCVLILSECLKNKEDKKMSKSFDNFDKKDVFSWANAEDAKEYIGKDGYFAESISILERDIEQQYTSRLIGVDTTEVCCFHARNKGNYSLFLPSDKVKEVKKPKKYRPFKNLNEFKKCISKDTLTCLDHGIEITDTLKIRQYRLMILGTFTNGIILPLYGALTFEELFKKFKININGNWQPFGALEK